MSLINDALKRAESEKRAAQSSASTPPLQPVESAPSSASPLLLGGIFLLGLGAIGIAAALWFGGRTNQVAQTTPNTTSSPAPARDITKVEVAVPADRSAPVVTQSTVTATTSTPPAVAPQPEKTTPKSIAATTSSPTTTTPPAAITPPASTGTQTKSVRLQSIFYRLKNPTVIINGKTLAVGETVDGIKVVSIQRTSVEIVQNGKYRTLTLQD